MFALHKAFEQSTKSVQDAARAERERRGQMMHSARPSPAPSAVTLPAESPYPRSQQRTHSHHTHQHHQHLRPEHLAGAPTPPRSPRIPADHSANGVYTPRQPPTPSFASLDQLPVQPGPPPTSKLPPLPTSQTPLTSSPARSHFAFDSRSQPASPKGFAPRRRPNRAPTTDFDDRAAPSPLPPPAAAVAGPSSHHLLPSPRPDRHPGADGSSEQSAHYSPWGPANHAHLARDIQRPASTATASTARNVPSSLLSQRTEAPSASPRTIHETVFPIHRAHAQPPQDHGTTSSGRGSLGGPLEHDGEPIRSASTRLRSLAPAELDSEHAHTRYPHHERQSRLDSVPLASGHSDAALSSSPEEPRASFSSTSRFKISRALWGGRRKGDNSDAASVSGLPASSDASLPLGSSPEWTGPSGMQAAAAAATAVRPHKGERSLLRTSFESRPQFALAPMRSSDSNGASPHSVGGHGDASPSLAGASSPASPSREPGSATIRSRTSVDSASGSSSFKRRSLAFLASTMGSGLINKGSTESVAESQRSSNGAPTAATAGTSPGSAPTSRSSFALPYDRPSLAAPALTPGQVNRAASSLGISAPVTFSNGNGNSNGNKGEKPRLSDASGRISESSAHSGRSSWSEINPDQRPSMSSSMENFSIQGLGVGRKVSIVRGPQPVNVLNSDALSSAVRPAPFPKDSQGQGASPGPGQLYSPFAAPIDTGFVPPPRPEEHISPHTLAPAHDYLAARSGALPAEVRVPFPGRTSDHLISVHPQHSQSSFDGRNGPGPSPTSPTEGDARGMRGTKLGRALSKRRPRTSGGEVGLSGLPAAAGRGVGSSELGRGNGPSGHPSLETSRTSASQEQQGRRQRANSIAGSTHSASAKTSGRPSTSTSQQLDGSRLDSSGGAAALFGGGSGNATSRSRASSLLPGLGIFGNNRARSSSNAGEQGGSLAARVALGIAGGAPGPRNRPPQVPPSQDIVSRVGANPASSRASGPASAPAETESFAAKAAPAPAPSPTPSPAHVANETTEKAEQTAEQAEQTAEQAAQLTPQPDQQASPADPGTPRAPVQYKHPKHPPFPSETPAEYANRLETSLHRGEIATILASSGDDFYSEALQSHMRRFLFVGNPLDIALRKLLMELCLPKETQQIDRVMEAFAKRYNECNEELYATEDQPYILAFSLMMLHTDAFNRNAKNKMTKADYIKNTSSSGVPQDILEYLYDNLTFTQFVYFDEADAQRRNQDVMTTPTPTSTSSFLSSMTPGSGSSKDKSNKIDAYLLIKQGRLSQFHPSIEHVIPEDDPYSYTGTETILDVPTLARAYMSAPSIEIAAQRRPSTGAPPNSNVGTWSGPEYSANAIGGSSSARDADEPSVTLRVFKVGIINRKDDVTDKGKKQSRKWKACGMILSSSQLLFFRDLVWIDALHAQIGEQLAAADAEERKQGILISPRITNFRPDGVLSLGDAIAVKDESYDKHKNVLRLIGTQGTTQHEYLFQARDETDMNEWIAGINFCACFRSVGVRVTNLDAVALSSARHGSSGDAHSTATGGVDAEFLRARVAARRRELVPRLDDVTRTLERHASELAELLRLARHFAIMTPFQRTTKERIELAAVPLAARIRQLRVLVAKYECRRFVLATEVQMGDLSTGTTASITELSPDTDGKELDPSLLSSMGVGQRKGSYFASEGAETEGTGTDGGDSAGMSPTGSEMPIGGGSGPRMLGSVSEANEADNASLAGLTEAGSTIGSFASQAQEKLHSEGATVSSSRSFKSKLGRSKSRTSSGQSEHLEVAESWQSTRAFRDPDRISLAQLPSIDQIEAATREKARRRGGTNATGSSGRKSSYAFSGSSISGSYKRSGGGGGSSSKQRGPGTIRSGGSSSSGRDAVPERPFDPPVFMPTWGV